MRMEDGRLVAGWICGSQGAISVVKANSSVLVRKPRYGTHDFLH